MACKSFFNQDTEFLFLLICSSLGILGCIIIITLQLKHKYLRGYFNTLILYISFSDLFRSIFTLIPCSMLPYAFLRPIFGIIIQSSFLISLFWSTCIPLFLYNVLNSTNSDFESYLKKCFIYLFSIPCLLALPILTNSYSSTDHICDISDSGIGFFWKCGLVYTPSIILILTSSITCIRIYLKLKYANISSQKKKMIRRISLFPIFMCIDVLPLIFFKISDFFLGVCSINQFNILSLGIFALNGVFNALLFASGNSFKEKRNDSLFQSIRSYNTSSFFSGNLLEESYNVPIRHK